MQASTDLSSRAQTVQSYLTARGFDFKVKQFPESTHTAKDAAAAIGCEVEQIVKSLIFMTEQSRKPVLALVSGPNRLDEKALVAHVGEKLVKADADFVREVTGFAIGGVPPIAHKTPLTTFIDEDLMQHETVWAAAGTPNAVFSLSSKALAQMTGGVVCTLKKV